MKRTMKVIIAGLVIAVVGLLVLIGAIAASGWNVNRVNEWQEDTFTAAATVERLDVKVNWGQVAINRCDTEKVTVKYEYDDKYTPKFDEKNGKLTIETSQKRWYEFGYWVVNAPRIEISVPQSVKLNEVQLTLNAGTVQFGDGEWCTTMSVKINAGTLSMGTVSVNELDLKLNAGAMEVKKIECDKVVCKMNAGAFDANEILCREFDCDISAGSANIKKLDAQAIDLDLSAGSASLGLVGAKSDYNISTKVSAGSCNVSSQSSASATRTVTVDVSAGSADLKFGN